MMQKKTLPSPEGGAGGGDFRSTDLTHHQKDLEKGQMKDWGVFAGEGRGYSVFEGAAEDIHLFIQKYVPFVIFETHPVIDADKAHEVVKKLV